MKAVVERDDFWDDSNIVEYSNSALGMKREGEGLPAMGEGEWHG
jgi:hypothetical protein